LASAACPLAAWLIDEAARLYPGAFQ